MNLLSLIRKPLIAAILGAVTIAVPAGALYLAGATRAVATTAAGSAATTSAATTPAAASPVTPAPPPPAAASPGPPPPAAASPATMLPDFSSMVQKYGPAVVNISVVSKVSTSWSSQGDENSDEPHDSANDRHNNNPNNNPFGPNSPFAPFFRGLPFQMP